MHLIPFLLASSTFMKNWTFYKLLYSEYSYLYDLLKHAAAENRRKPAGKDGSEGG
jgi:hypothetical protein